MALDWRALVSDCCQSAMENHGYEEIDRCNGGKGN